MARILLVLALVLGWAGDTFAEERSSLLPDVPAATGDPHPEGNEYWRKNHPRLLLHDRDLTMREGEREVQASLKQCFECHAVKDEAGAYVSYEDERNFCRVCHDYAAVKVDCFMCHRSTPEEGLAQSALAPQAPAGGDETRNLIAYLEKLDSQVRTSSEPEATR